MNGGPRFAIGEADLHGLVDNRLDSDRQADLLRRLRSHPADRVRVESWREQNVLLRATFSGVESEPLPVSLNLAPPPRLRCVASDGYPTVPIAALVSRGIAGRTRKGAALMLLGTVMGCAIAASAWWMFVRPAPSVPYSVAASRDERLVAFAVDALARPPVQIPPSAARDLPSLTIPDLGDSGFGFKSATLVSTDPSTLVFLFENGSADHVALAVAKADQTASGEPAASVPIQLGRAILWRHHGQAAALAGTVEARRLSAIALDLRAMQDADQP